MIIETCPKCGNPLMEYVVLTYPPIPKKECPRCRWSWEGKSEKIVYKPFDENNGRGNELQSNV